MFILQSLAFSSSLVFFFFPRFSVLIHLYVHFCLFVFHCWYSLDFLNLRYGVFYCFCAVLCLVTQSCLTLCDPMDCSPPGFSVHGDSPDKNTGVCCHVLFHGVFSTQGCNPSLLYCGRILYHLSDEGSPRILEWVAYPFSRAFSWPRNWTGVSCIAGGLFTWWATR